MSMSRRLALAAALACTLPALAVPAAAQYDRDGMQRWLQVQNASPVTIREFYMTDRDTRNWGPDLLGAEVVPPGTQMRVYPTANQRARGYCVYDMRVVFSDNSVVEARQVNLCVAAAIRCTSTNRCTVLR